MAADRPVMVLMAASSPWSQLAVEYLSRAGLSIHVVDYNDPDPSGANRELDARTVAALRTIVAAVHQVPLRGAFPARLLAGAWTLRRLARACDARMVLALYGGMQAAVAFLSGIRPYAVYVVGSDVLRASPLRRLIARAALGRASTVFANGRHLADRTRDLAPGAPVQLLYFGIDLTRFRPSAARRPAPRFVCSRTFFPVTDNATIVRALAAVQATPPDFALAFLSTGPLLEETLALADRVLAPGLRAGVTFARGVTDAQMVEALRSASFYLSASHSDGTSVSLLEAMACGLVPIVSDIPANREWVTHGENGLLFPPGDPEALAACLRQAFERPRWLDAAAEANVRMVAERGNIEVNLRRLYQQLLPAGVGEAPAARPA